jgi:hypothetical protein
MAEVSLRQGRGALGVRGALGLDRRAAWSQVTLPNDGDSNEEAAAGVVKRKAVSGAVSVEEVKGGLRLLAPGATVKSTAHDKGG